MAEANKYIPIFLDFTVETRELSDAEVGRLVKALVMYARGEDWSEVVSGNERIVFPSFQLKVDRHFEFLQMQREKGKARASQGQQKPADASRSQPTSADVSRGQPTPAKNNNKNNNKENNNNNKKNIESVGGMGGRASRFTPPTTEEVRAYCQEQGYKIDADRFLAYYESNGWKVGRNPMKDWKAAVRTWVRNDATGSQPSKPTPTAMQFEQRDYTGVDFSALNADLSKYK